MRHDTVFHFTKCESDIANMEKVMISVDDDSATDQDLLTEIQMKSSYATRKLAQLYEVSPGEWSAYFKL
jgi:hypothetical protein